MVHPLYRRSELLVRCINIAEGYLATAGRSDSTTMIDDRGGMRRPAGQARGLNAFQPCACCALPPYACFIRTSCNVCSTSCCVSWSNSSMSSTVPAASKAFIYRLLGC
jgi:hypothetical protein